MLLQWLNRMLQGMWPYYDKAIGAAIKEAVEPMMEQYKPPGLIKKIYFSKLTFGDAPIRIDNVWVEDEGENHVLMEVGILALVCVFDGYPNAAGHANLYHFLSAGCSLRGLANWLTCGLHEPVCH